MFRKCLKRMTATALAVSIFTTLSVTYARDSQFTRQGSGPMYWMSYEHQWTKNTFMPESRLKDNIDWMAKNFLPYGYNMVSLDGWIEGATMLNKNGYVVSHNDSWMTNPLDMTGGGETATNGQLINGDFEDGETGWTFTGSTGHGVDANDARNGHKLWMWDAEPHIDSAKQTVKGLEDGQYVLTAWIKLIPDQKPSDYNADQDSIFITNGSKAEIRLTEPEKTPVKKEILPARDEYKQAYRYQEYKVEVNVTNGELGVEFYIDAKGKNTSIQIDDVTLEKLGAGGDPVWQYPEEKYPNGHTWKFWADYAKGKGLDFGIYYNPLWISPEVVNHPDQYKVIGTDTPVADLVIQGDPENKLDGDRFNGGQGSERALYWLNMKHPLAKKFLQGYVQHFKNQGAKFLRVDFLSWYETGTDINLGQLGQAHDREDYDKAIQWMEEACGEDMLLSLVMPHLKNHGATEQKYGDMIRIDEDVFGGGWDHVSGRRQNWQGEVWSQWASAFQGFTGFADINGRGSLINDGDFIRLNTFSGQDADNERKSEISLFTIAGSPITIADQYDTIGDLAKYYQNPELIELNKMGLVGKPIFNSSEHYKDNTSRDSERWVGQLPDGSYVVGLFNRSNAEKAFTFDFGKELGIEEGFVRDLWAHQDMGTKQSHTVVLDPHDSVVIKVVPTAQVKKYQAEAASYKGAKFDGPNYQSGAQFNNKSKGYTGFGYVESIAASDDKVTFAIDAPKDGDYKFNIHYANGGGAASVDFDAREKVSGAVINSTEVVLPTVKAGAWDQWGTVKQSLTLKKGINIVTIKGKSGSINLDSIEMILGASEAAIINGNFEDGTTGWNKVGDGWWGVDSNDAYEGSKLYNYFPEPGEAATSQKITNAADGKYKVTVMAKLMPHSYPNFENGVCELKITQPGLPAAVTNIKPKVKDGIQIVPGQKIGSDGFEYQEYSVEADVKAGEMNIEFHTRAPQGDTSLQIDNVKIEKLDGQVEDTGVPIHNADFEAGFENWSRSSMIHQSIKVEGSNNYVHTAADTEYNSDLWQYAVPGAGTYTFKAKVRSKGDFDESILYVNYAGGSKKVTIPKSADWVTVQLPNIIVQAGEVVKLGALVNGKAGSSVDIDEVQLVRSNPEDYQAAALLGNLSSENPYKVDGNGVIFNFEKAHKVKVDFMNDEITRVWMEPSGIFKKDKSFVVNDENAKVNPVVKDEGKYIKVSTNALTVRVYKEPFRIEYYDASNSTLIKGEPADGGLKYDGDTGVYQTMTMDKDEHFYGLGMDRHSKTLDRRGKTVVMKNDMVGGDASGNVSDISGTFFVSTKGYGIFFDNTYEKTTFDMGAAKPDQYSFSAPNGEMVYYFMKGQSLDQVMQNYAELSGKAPLPPKWALGFIQSKFGYKSWDEVNKIVDTFRTKGIPVDGMVLDAYWAPQNHYFDMSWSSAFANPKQAMDALAQKGIKMTNIVDPYVQVTSNLFQEGDKKGYFVKDSASRTVVYDAWYGKSGLIDFTNIEAAKWYTDKVKQLHDVGVKGWWIDLNEPEKATDSLRDHFKEGNASEIRNAYALNEAKAFYDGQRSYTDERVWSLARSGFSGIQEYGTTVWSGDVNSTWDALTHNLELGLSTGMSGIPYFANDTGGFREGPPSAELYTRWMQAAAFMPIFRAHGDDSANQGKGTREPWVFGKEAEVITTNTIKQRYRLLPYIYTTAKDTYETNKPIMRPLIMDYTNDAQVTGIQDQWMFGPSMLVAPIHTKGAISRDVYLPKGVWYDWNDASRFDGSQTVKNYDAPLNKIPIFVKEGSIIPMGQDINYVGEKQDDQITLKVYPSTTGVKTTYSLYEDDGKSYGYETGKYAVTDMEVSKVKDQILLNLGAIQGDYTGKAANRTWSAEVKIDAGGKVVYKMKRNKHSLREVDSVEAVKTGNDVWYYDAETEIVYFNTSKVSTSESQEILIDTKESTNHNTINNEFSK